MDLTWASQLISSQIKGSVQQRLEPAKSKPTEYNLSGLKQALDQTLINHSEVLSQLGRDFKVLLAQLDVSTSKDTNEFLLHILSQSPQQNLSFQIEEWLQLVSSPQVSPDRVKQLTQHILTWVHSTKSNISQNTSHVISTFESIPKELTQILGHLERNQLSDILSLKSRAPLDQPPQTEQPTNAQLPLNVRGQFQSEIQSIIQNFAPDQSIPSHLEDLAKKFLKAKTIDFTSTQEGFKSQKNLAPHFPILIVHHSSGVIQEPKALLQQLNLPMDKIQQLFQINQQISSGDGVQVNPSSQSLTKNYSSLSLNTTGQSVWFPPNPQLALRPSDLHMHQEAQIPPTFRSVEDLRFIQGIIQANPRSSLVAATSNPPPIDSTKVGTPQGNFTLYGAQSNSIGLKMTEEDSDNSKDTRQTNRSEKSSDPFIKPVQKTMPAEQSQKLLPVFKSYHQHHYNLEASFPAGQTPLPQDKQQLLSSLLNLKQAYPSSQTPSILQQFNPPQALQTQLYKWIQSPESLLPTQEDMSDNLQQSIARMFKEKPLLNSEEFQRNIESLLQKSESNSSPADSIPLKRLLHFTNWTKLENEPPQENQRDQNFFWSQDGELYHSKIMVRDERIKNHSADEESNPIVHVYTIASHIGEISAMLQRKTPHSHELIIKIEDESGTFSHEFDDELPTLKKDLMQIGLILKDFIYSARLQLKSFKEPSQQNGDSTLDLHA